MQGDYTSSIGRLGRYPFSYPLSRQIPASLIELLIMKTCKHGLSDKNWCALCRKAAGDEHATKIIKAFTPKVPKTCYMKVADRKKQHEN